jgi:ceramide glucosyltransferase
MHIWVGFIAIFCCTAVAPHLATIMIVRFRARESERIGAVVNPPGVSILRPLCGTENNLEETLATTFNLDYPLYEIIFCVASDSDASIPMVQRLIAIHPATSARLLVGNDCVSVNPKLNNLIKGWAAARYDWIVMTDSNVLLPCDYLRRLFARWTPGTGLVTSPPIGVWPVGFWAELECAFLNTYQARWQLTADEFGFGFAQGKNMFWRRDILERAGGIGALAAETAEDAAATKIVRKAGLLVRLSQMPFAQPLGRRSFSEVWRRQLRWARLRRQTFRAFFIPELITGGLFPLGAALLLAITGGASLLWVFALCLVWYGAELWLARSAGWPSSFQSVLAAVLRDVLLPVLWVFAWGGDHLVWRQDDKAAKVELLPIVAAGSLRDPEDPEISGASG